MTTDIYELIAQYKYPIKTPLIDMMDTYNTTSFFIISITYENSGLKYALKKTRFDLQPSK